jgi:hypothetical protein
MVALSAQSPPHRGKRAGLREGILTFGSEYVQLNSMRSRQFQDALGKLTKVIREVEAVVETMRAEHDPLASHIFVSRRHYQNLSDTKGGKRRAMSAQLSWQTASEHGFRGNLDEWERFDSRYVFRKVRGYPHLRADRANEKW